MTGFTSVGILIKRYLDNVKGITLFEIKRFIFSIFNALWLLKFLFILNGTYLIQNAGEDVFNFKLIYYNYLSLNLRLKIK